METRDKKCIICYEDVPDWNWRDCLSFKKINKLSENLAAIFLLRKLLGIPSSICEKFLKNVGNPSEWISTCSRCELRVKEAVFINSQINELSEKLDACSKEIRKEIRETQTFELTSPSSQSDDLGFVNVTKETREYVAQCQGDVQGDRLFPDVTIKFEVDVDDYIPEGFDEEGHSASGAELIQNECKESNNSCSEYAKPLQKRSATMKDSEKSLACSICNEYLATENELIGHRREYHDDLRQKANATGECEFCGKKYKLAKSLRAHRLSAHNARFYYTKNVSLESPIRTFQDTPKIVRRQSQKIDTDDLVVEGIPEEDSARPEVIQEEIIESDKSNPTNPDCPEHPLYSVIALKDSAKAFDCSICNASFTTSEEFTVHRREYHDDLRRKANVTGECEFCGKKYKLPNSLRAHRLSAHNARFFYANNATRKISKAIDTNEKIVDVNDTETTLSESISGNGSANKKRSSARILHRKSKGKVVKYTEEAKDNAESSDGSNEWVPELQNNVNSDVNPEKSLKLRKLKKSLQIFQCEQCIEQFKSKVQLYSHLAKSHEIKIKDFKCTICNHASRTKASLRVHMQSHTGDRPYLCEICSKTFTHKNYLRWHTMKEHSDESKPNPFSCDQCDKICSNIYALRNHKRTKHEKIYKCICHICGAGFQSDVVMKIHMYSHTKEKPNKCSYPECTAAYSQLNSLKRHIRAQHTKEKPYKCSQCDKKFGGYANWKRHELSIHSDLRPFKCEMCDKAFAVRTYLHTHMKSHNNRNRNSKSKTEKYLKDNIKVKQPGQPVTTTQNMESPILNLAVPSSSPHSPVSERILNESEFLENQNEVLHRFPHTDYINVSNLPVLESVHVDAHEVFVPF